MQLEKQIYIDKDLPAGWKPYYIFLMKVNNEIVGRMTLREGSCEERYYDGHIGYTVEPEFRGHYYAYQGVQLIKPIALKLVFKELIITCSPNNLASKKTILKLQAQYLETVEIPKKYRKDFEAGETIKEVYLIKL